MATTDAPPLPPRSVHLPVFLAVWCSFFLYGAIAAPVPAVNEPHYLCKARHFWQPDWCANDFFLQSANAHTVFFATVGSLTQWMSLDQAAWIGRVLAILVLTGGWCSLLAPYGRCRWHALYVCWSFLALASCGNLSGEWLVGGVEGKVFSYGFLFGALGKIQRGCLIRAGVLAGLAVAFHPVIGVWGLLAFAGACIIERGLWPLFLKTLGGVAGAGPTGSPGSLIPQQHPSRNPHQVAGAGPTGSPGSGIAGSGITGVSRSAPTPATPPASSFQIKPGIVESLSGVAALIVCALPGLIPVFSLLAESVPEKTKSAANFIQVYYRLAHHLDPMKFLPRAYLGYGALLAVWLIVMVVNRRSPAHRRFDRIVAFAVLFAVAGLIIGWGPRPAQGMVWYAERAKLLKFYPFRVADVLIPLAVSMGVVNWLEFTVRRGTQCIGYGALFVVALLQAHSHVEVSRYSGELRADWIDACHWIDQHLASDALVHSPHNGWAFKWFAQRAEYVAFKDCPQDAAGIVEWNRRLNFLKHWFEVHYDDEFYSADELRDFRGQTKVTHILTDRLGPMELEPIFENDTFQVYDLTVLD